MLANQILFITVPLVLCLQSCSNLNEIAKHDESSKSDGSVVVYATWEDSESKGASGPRGRLMNALSVD